MNMVFRKKEASANSASDIFHPFVHKVQPQQLSAMFSAIARVLPPTVALIFPCRALGTCSLDGATRSVAVP